MSRIRYTIQNQDQLPGNYDWLTDGERERFEGFRFEKRRRDWLLGRWTAKHLLTIVESIEPDHLEIATGDDGAPLPMLHGALHPVALSLSHSHGRAMVTVARGEYEHGCDIELIESRSAEFIETFFTAAEQASVAATEPGFRDALVTITWSAKESTLKALRSGLRQDTRSAEVGNIAEPRDGGWQIASVTTNSNGHFACFWRIDNDFVLTVVAREPAEPPTLIR